MWPAAAAFVAALMSGPVAWAQAETYRLAPQTQRVEIGAVGYLRDAEGRLTAAEVATLAERGALQAVSRPKSPGPRLTQDAITVWLKMDFASEAGTPAQWMLDIGTPIHDRVSVFTRAKDGSWVGTPEVGAGLPFSARIVPHRDFVFPVQLPPGDTTSVLVRVRDTSSAPVRAALWRPEALRASDSLVVGLFFLYYGLLGGMLIYNLLLYVVVRDRGFLIYVAFISSIAVAVAGNTGLAAQYVCPDCTAWPRVTHVAYLAALFFSGILTRHFLSTRDRVPRADRFMQAIIWATGAGVLVALLLPKPLAPTLVTLSSTATSLMTSGLSILAVLRRWPGAAYFCAALLLLHASSLIAVLGYYRLLDWSVSAPEALAIGSAMEMVLLSLALADRINEARRQKDRAQAQTMAILRASQALGSETRLEPLHAKLCDVLAEVTGASAVHLLLRDGEAGQWFAFTGREHLQRLPVQEAHARGVLSLSALHHVEHTREPLMVEDATRDERFASEPVFAGAAHCALLVMPILRHGELMAALVLENRAAASFPEAALGAVRAIAGALAVALENVQLYENLEQRVDEQTRELRQTHQQLLATARRAGMAEVATNVLHNVGNTLNSVNVATELMRKRVTESRVGGLGRAARLMRAHSGQIGAFMEHDPKGRALPQYLQELSLVLEHERQELLEHLGHLAVSVDHIKNVVATQQTYAGPSVLVEQIAPAALAENALRIVGDTFRATPFEVARDFADIPPVRLDKTRTLQILVNLLTNACQAMADTQSPARVLTLRLDTRDGTLRYQVQDGGCGIPAENMARIFSHGFTTRAGGHGFGLHSCALAAREMGGNLRAHSDGPGRGSTFTLELPLVLA